MAYTRLDQPLQIGGVYTQHWSNGRGSSNYLVTDIEDDQLIPFVHLQRLSDGWEMDVAGAGLYQTLHGVSLLWDYSVNGHWGSKHCAAQ